MSHAESPSHRGMTTSRTTDMGNDIDADRWSATSAAEIGDPCDALPEQVRSHSRGRPWRGLAVWHQVGPPGDLYIPRIKAHTILVRRAGPTELVQRHGGTVQRRRWMPGEAIIVPSGEIGRASCRERVSSPV